MHTFSNLFSQRGFWAPRNGDGRNPQTTYTYDLNRYNWMANNMQRPINQSAPHTHINVITATENLMQEFFLRSMNLSFSVLITNSFLGSAKWQKPRKKERSNKLRNLFIVQSESRISEKKTHENREAAVFGHFLAKSRESLSLRSELFTYLRVQKATWGFLNNTRRDF